MTWSNEYPLAILSAVILVVGLGLMAGPYLAVRVCDLGAARPDPQLGFKAAAHFFFSLGLLIGLAGATVICWESIDRLVYPSAPAAPPPLPPGLQGPGPTPAAGRPARSWKSPVYRTGAGLVVTGVTVALLSWVLIRVGTNHRVYPAVGRAYTGARLGIAGLLAVIALAWVNVLLFLQVPRNHHLFQMMIAVLMVWMPAAAVHMFWLRSLSRRPYHPADPKPEGEE